MKEEGSRIWVVGVVGVKGKLDDKAVDNALDEQASMTE